MALNQPIQYDGWQWLSKRNVSMCRVNATYQKAKPKELLKKKLFFVFQTKNRMINSPQIRLDF